MTSGLREQLEKLLGQTYDFKRELGGGGMARVFLVSDRALKRQVVIKVLAPERAGAVSAERFVREIHLAARLQHPNIVPLLSAGDADGLPYYTMPYVAGESLRSRLSRNGALSIADALPILRDVAAALAYAHGEGVVHRDIKPDNVLLSADGHAQVTDFGIAKALGVAGRAGALTGVGFSVGTPAYMAPEQVLGDPAVDHHADLYSWAVLAYEALSGRTPFCGNTTQALATAHLTSVPDRLSKHCKNIPPWLDQLVSSCLAKVPSERPDRAEDVVHMLDSRGDLAPASWKPIRHGWTRATAFALISGVVLLAALTLWPRLRGDSDNAKTAATASIAVLPFANLSSDKENDYFSDGMTDELINTLANVPGLRVTARSSVFALKGKELDARDVARRLGVTRVVEGSVRRERGKIRLTAQLVDAASGRTLWSQTYQRDVRDALAIQEELARAITLTIQPRLEPTGRTVAARRPTQNPEAYDLYLQAEFLFNQRSKSSLLQSLTYFNRAIRLDSAFALAYAGIASSYNVLADHGYMPVDGALPLARAAANRAIELDETASEAHIALGYIKTQFDMDQAGAEREYRRALALSPGSAYGHYTFGSFLADRGRFDNAIEQIQLALQLDPLSPIIRANFGRVLAYAGRTNEAIEQCRRVVQLNPGFGVGHFWLGAMYLYAHRQLEAIAELDVADSLMVGSALPRAVTAIAHAGLGERERALEIIRELEKPTPSRPDYPYVMAAAYVALGDSDRAFYWLDRGYSEHATGMDFLAVDPFFDRIRSDPRYAVLAEKMGLSP